MTFNRGFLRKMWAFSGPGYMVAVGYMDPGNWATDLAGGSAFGYTLLSVIFISNLMAILLQHLSVKLGIATGHDLAQACKQYYSKSVSIVLWVLAEIAIIACDLAEIIGSAIGLQLLFKIPLLIGIVITVCDVLLLLLLQHKGYRYLEALVFTLVVTIIACFGIEIWLTSPPVHAMLLGLIPSLDIVTHPRMLYLAIGILGATVMPHNLYLHSSIVKNRGPFPTEVKKKEAIFFSTLDSSMALGLAFFVNAAILVVSASVFFGHGMYTISDIYEAHHLLTPLLGTSLASVVFALALLASGQNSTLTGTLAGQVIMEGFLHIRLAPWLRRLITRLLALVPAVCVIVLFGQAGIAKLLILSQVVLSLQLSFAVFPLVMFTSDRKKMGSFVNGPFIKPLSFTIALLIASLNGWLIWQSL